MKRVNDSGVSNFNWCTYNTVPTHTAQGKPQKGGYKDCVIQKPRISSAK